MTTSSRQCRLQLSVVLFFTFVSLSYCKNETFLPVVIMHGILDSWTTMQPLVDFIKEASPDTPVVAIDAFNWMYSIENMWHQVQGIIQAMRDLPVAFNVSKGYNCIGFSQGTVLMRGIIEYWSDHKCVSLISLSGPQMGQFGQTSYLQFFFPNYTRDSMYKIFYTETFQNHFSVAGYWRDGSQLPLYRLLDTYLAHINNESGMMPAVYKPNFLKLKRLVLAGGADDGVITPWQSALFGTYNNNATQVIDMEDQEVYIKDWFGLKTLDKRGGVRICRMDGIEHSSWYQDKDVFLNCVFKHLLRPNEI